MAMILVSHDLGVGAAATQTVAVMYAGMVVEHGLTECNEAVPALETTSAEQIVACRRVHEIALDGADAA